MTSALRPSSWLVCAALISAAALAFVHILQSQGYIPCELCLRQREVYWTALAIAVVGVALSEEGKVFPRARGPIFSKVAPVACVAVGVCFLVGAGVAAYHAGVEWKWWPGPTACTGANAGGAVGAAQVADIFSGKTKLHMVRCDEAAIRILGLSLSGWNALASVALAMISFAALTLQPRSAA